MFEKKDKKTIINLITAFAVGVGLIVLGGMFDTGQKNSSPAEEKSTEDERETDYCSELEKKLENIFAACEGVGRIKVMITLRDDGRKKLAEDVSREKNSDTEGTNSEKEEIKTLLTEGNMPYIINRSCPEVEGVLITCDGGGNIQVKSSLINGCAALFGIEANKIEVLKMGGN